jgi:hypothetical protein
LERGFLGFGEASAQEQVQSNPVTEPKRSQNPKRPLPSSIQPDGYSISLNALESVSINDAPWLSCRLLPLSIHAQDQIC